MTDVPRYRHPVFALQYDLSEAGGHHLDDLTWYAERTADRDPGAGPLLEIGAGTGRVTRHLTRHLAGHLAGRGHRVIPTDIGHAMLRRLVDGPAPVSSWRAVTCDCRSLPFGTAVFGSALSAYNVWGCLDEPADLERALREVARVLKPGAPLWFDVAMQQRRDFSTQTKRFGWQTWTSPDGFHIRRRTTLRHRPEREWLELTYELRWRDPGGNDHEETVEFGLNTWPLDRYLDAARTAAFEVDDVERKSFEGPDGRTPMWAFVSLTNGR